VHNLMEKFSAAEVQADEEGVVAIEYVVVAAAIVVALGALWTAFGADLAAKLAAIVAGI